MSDRAKQKQNLSAEEKRKLEDKERKKAEVRARLEEAARAKKGKKGFMTPERKKKLRKLLRAKAAEELKIEQERKAGERRKEITKRTGQPKHEGANEATLQQICKEYHERISKLENIKYDLEFEVRQKDFVVNELSIEVNDMRGKFMKPSLKKVSKYDQKLEKMAKVAAKAETDFRNNLKRVQSQKFTIGDDEKQAKPEWALKKEQEKQETETEEIEIED